MYANCLIVAIVNKIRHPSNKIYAIKPKNNPHGNFHTMWKDKDGRNYHFTRDKKYDVKYKRWFKGHVEEMYPGTIEKMKGIRIL